MRSALDGDWHRLSKNIAATKKAPKVVGGFQDYVRYSDYAPVMTVTAAAATGRGRRLSDTLRVML